MQHMPLKRLSMLLLILLMLTGCDQAPERMEALSLRLALPLQPSSGLAIVAQQKGYFEKNGLALQVSEHPSGKRALNDSFFPGKSDIALAAEVPLVMAAFAQRPFKLVATIFSANNVNGIIARRDAGIQTVADLKGKRLATQRASAVHFFLHLFLVEHAIAERSVDIAFHKAEQLADLLANGKIDAFSMREPYISQAKAKLGSNHILFKAPGLYQQIDVVVVQPRLLEERPEVVRRLLQALSEAETYIHSHPKEAIKLISQRLGVAPSTLEQNWPEMSMRLSLNQSMLVMMEDIARWAIKSGMVEPQLVPDFLDLIVPGPLQAIAPRAVTLIQ